VTRSKRVSDYPMPTTAAEFERHLDRDTEYRDVVEREAIAGTLPDQLEVWLWELGYGPPEE
jgi:hypothetical protein